MKTKFMLGLLLGLLISLIGALINFDNIPTVHQAQAAVQIDENMIHVTRSEPLIIDHTTADITAIPQYWIEEAKQKLHIGYGHTSHGSQITSGMSGLVGFANGGGKGLSLPENIFQFNHDGNDGGKVLHLFEGDGYGSGDLDHDCGYFPDWVDETRDYLGTPDPNTGRGTNHPEINVIMWSWCGQAGSRTEQTMLDTYLLPMTQLELDYPGIVFVYMTGHADGDGENSNLHERNMQIRQYAIDNNKVLFDFYDFDMYDPDGNYYGDKDVDDDCTYDSGDWCDEWQNSHTEGEDWYSVSCSHSQSINCNQKAYGAWWLWASLAGWNQPTDDPDLSPSNKTASQPTVVLSDTLTYTIQIVNAGGALAGTVSLTDTIPAGLSYIPGSLTATSGTIDDSAAPALTWSGVLTPTPAITLTYAVSVTTSMPDSLTNTVVIAAPGVDPITRSATIFANAEQLYLPLLNR